MSRITPLLARFSEILRIGGLDMVRLNVQVQDDLFDKILQYACRYRITRAAAVSCLLSYALEQLDFEISKIRANRL